MHIPRFALAPLIRSLQQSERQDATSSGQTMRIANQRIHARCKPASRVDQRPAPNVDHAKMTQAYVSHRESSLGPWSGFDACWTKHLVKLQRPLADHEGDKQFSHWILPSRRMRSSVCTDRSRCVLDNNRPENFDLAFRRRERKQHRFKSQRSAQRILATHAAVRNNCNVQRHLIRRPTLRLFRAEADRAWATATAACAPQLLDHATIMRRLGEGRATGSVGPRSNICGAQRSLARVPRA
jgi:hypothetical protein